jgi:hypothetical protein
MGNLMCAYPTLLLRSRFSARTCPFFSLTMTIGVVWLEMWVAQSGSSSASHRRALLAPTWDVSLFAFCVECRCESPALAYKHRTNPPTAPRRASGRDRSQPETQRQALKGAAPQSSSAGTPASLSNPPTFCLTQESDVPGRPFKINLATTAWRNWRGQARNRREEIGTRKGFDTQRRRHRCGIHSTQGHGGGSHRRQHSARAMIT